MSEMGQVGLADLFVKQRAARGECPLHRRILLAERTGNSSAVRPKPCPGVNGVALVGSR
jgi:hypothetical protein